MESSNGNLRIRKLLKRRKFLKKVKDKSHLFELSALIGLFYATFFCVSALPADASTTEVYAEAPEVFVITTTSTEVSTTERKEETTVSFTTKVTEAPVTSVAKTTTAIETTTISQEMAVSELEIVFSENEIEVVEEENIQVYEEPAYEPEPEYYPEPEPVSVQEVQNPYEENGDRTRPEITSGVERLASMMAIEGGESDITCVRTAIGFMNRIHNSQFNCGSIENVYGYCFSTPNEHHLELASQVIEAYNGSDSSWFNYCVEHQLTDKTVYHHNGSYSEWFEQPGGYVEYGNSGYYSWTLIYSEGIYDHY